MISRKKLILLFVLIHSLISMANSAVRIVSLSPTVTKMLYQLNAQKSIVGCTSYCEVDKSDNIPIIASVVDVNIEKTLLLKPTIVFATGMTPPANIENMRKLGLNVKIIYSPKTFHEVCQQFIEIGAMVGKEKEAKTIVVKQKARIEELKLKIPKNNKPKIFFQIGARPLFTVLSNTFMDEYIKYLGGVNIAADLGSGTITRESVLVRNPDIIIITAMGIASNDEKKEWETFKNLSAVKANRIFAIESGKSCQATPINFTETIEELINLIYK